MPLHAAIIACKRQSIITLLAKGACGTYYTSKRKRGLHYAILNTYLDPEHQKSVVLALLKSRINVADLLLTFPRHAISALGTTVQKDIYEALCLAGKTGNYEIFKLILENFLPENKNNFYEAGLFSAIKKGHTPIVELLIKKNVDVKYTRQFNEEKAKPYLEKLNMVSNERCSDLIKFPLSIAATNGHVDSVKLLLKLDSININTQSVSFVAVSDLELFGLLLKAPKRPLSD